MQRRHSIRHLAWRGGVAAVSGAMMVTGMYPLLPLALLPLVAAHADFDARRLAVLVGLGEGGQIVRAIVDMVS